MYIYNIYKEKLTIKYYSDRFQFALAIMILLYYRRLKHNNAQERTLDDLRTAYTLY